MTLLLLSPQPPNPFSKVALGYCPLKPQAALKLRRPGVSQQHVQAKRICRRAYGPFDLVVLFAIATILGASYWIRSDETELFAFLCLVGIVIACTFAFRFWSEIRKLEAIKNLGEWTGIGNRNRLYVMYCVITLF
jgi:hypothetical protein